MKDYKFKTIDMLPRQIPDFGEVITIRLKDNNCQIVSGVVIGNEGHIELHTKSVDEIIEFSEIEYWNYVKLD